jgi:hypothetical protein
VSNKRYFKDVILCVKDLQVELYHKRITTNKQKISISRKEEEWYELLHLFQGLLISPLIFITMAR